MNLLDVCRRLDDHASALGVALAQWDTRDAAKAQPGVRQAANAAMDAIDGMLAELHRVRDQLVGEIVDHDDAFHARLDARYGPVPSA